MFQLLLPVVVECNVLWANLRGFSADMTSSWIYKTSLSKFLTILTILCPGRFSWRRLIWLYWVWQMWMQGMSCYGTFSCSSKRMRTCACNGFHRNAKCCFFAELTDWNSYDRSTAGKCPSILGTGICWKVKHIFYEPNRGTLPRVLHPSFIMQRCILQCDQAVSLCFNIRPVKTIFRFKK